MEFFTSNKALFRFLSHSFTKIRRLCVRTISDLRYEKLPWLESTHLRLKFSYCDGLISTCQHHFNARVIVRSQPQASAILPFSFSDGRFPILRVARGTNCGLACLWIREDEPGFPWMISLIEGYVELQIGFTILRKQNKNLSRCARWRNKTLISAPAHLSV